MLWLMRFLVPLNGYKEFLNQGGFDNDNTAKMIGLGHWINPVNRNFDEKQALKELRELHRMSEEKLDQTMASGIITRNIKKLSNLVGLSETDCRVLEFAVFFYNENALEDTSYYLGSLSSRKVIQVLSVLLNIPEQDVQHSLSPKSALTKSGLLTLSINGTKFLANKLETLSKYFTGRIFSSDCEPFELLRGMVSEPPPSALSLADYSHLDREISILLCYLGNALQKRKRGVNIFLYGSPGTGKTELVRVIAHKLECELFEIAFEDEDGNPIKGENRLRSFRAAQSFFSLKQALLLFDEVEDIFDDGDDFWGKNSTAQTHKAWINRMLEDNPVPAFWLSNSTHRLDPAFVRRFDMFIKVPVPPKRHREKIIRNTCSDLLDDESISRAASIEELSPAVVTRTASVIASIREQLGREQTSEAFELIAGNTLEVQGHERILSHDPNRLPETYDPAFINTNGDVEKIAVGLKKNRMGRLCLYGPPGTGKTAYGRWLAEQLDMPLMVKRASDLISPFLGMTERNFARTFRNAQREGALLLIDEVDSFLQERRGAQRGWEVTEVNEMLTQIESFPGVFVASTNLIDNLDQAALRRFDIKMKFDFLRPDQLWLLFERQCHTLGLDSPPKSLQAEIRMMINVTPGDFAAITRRHHFLQFSSPAEVLHALKEECQLKDLPIRSIGFL